MDAKEQIEACIKLAESSSKRHDARREYEWKLTIALWTVILAAIVYIRKEALPAPSLEFWLLAWFIHGFFWLRGLWVANNMDKNKSLHFRKQAERLLYCPAESLEPIPEDTENPFDLAKRHWQEGRRHESFKKGLEWSCGFIPDWSLGFQFLTTLFLVLLAYFLTS